MLIQSKVTTLQVVKESLIEKPCVTLNNSSHSTKDTIPVIIDISANEPIQINNIGIEFKLIHPLTGIILAKFETVLSDFIFFIIQPNIVKATLYISNNQIPTYYEWRGLDFSPREHKILYELQISVKTAQQSISKITNTGSFHVH